MAAVSIFFGAVLLIGGLLQLLGWSIADDNTGMMILLAYSFSLFMAVQTFRNCLNGTIKALIIDEKGIYDNSKWPNSLGFVDWKKLKQYIHAIIYLLKYLLLNFMTESIYSASKNTKTISA